MSQNSNKKDILAYAQQIWKTADILRGVSIKDSHWPEYMMPMFGLLMTESRILRKIAEYELEYGSREEAVIEYIADIKEKIKFGASIYGMNDLLVEKGKTLKDVCENDTGFNAILQQYLEAYDAETKDLLGIIPREGDNKLDLNKYLKILDDKGVKFQYMQAWSKIDLTDFDNSEITTLEEHIKRKWADISAETAGQQYTPSDIISLISNISVAYYNEYTDSAKNLNIYDMTCGGGNMLFGIEDNIDRMLISNETPEDEMPHMTTHGQEYESSLYALAKIESRFRRSSKIEYGNTLTTDMFAETKMNIIGANPPYGVDWKHEEKALKEDKTDRYHHYPSVGDGQLLFLQHAISKLSDDPSQLSLGCVVLNGSPLFSGDAGSGESAVRKWILDNDYLEALIQLPTNEFFNTGITTYIWVINKNKNSKNKNKIKLIDSSEMFIKLKKSKGQKTKEISLESQHEIVDLLMKDEEHENVKILDKSFFYYNKQKITLTHADETGKSFVPMNKDKVVKSVKIENIVKVDLFDESKHKETVILSELVDSGDLKSLAKERNEKFNGEEGTILVKCDNDESYHFDTKSESLIKTLANGAEESLGCGTIKLKASYKKATKTKEEHIAYHLELAPKTETDYETIPFSFNEKSNSKKIQEFMNKWVEKAYILEERTVGVEVNFNKIFYKPEVLRPLEEIKNELLASHDKLSQLMGDVFND